jgi:hypothetical protein
MSPYRLAALLTAAAGLALAIAPARAAFDGTIEGLAWIRIALLLVTAWGLALQAGWARWAIVLLAAWCLASIFSAWRVPPMLRGMIPYFTLWRAMRTLGGLLALGAAIVGWNAPRERDA